MSRVAKKNAKFNKRSGKPASIYTIHNVNFNSIATLYKIIAPT